ncbi:MAG: hypothetical protein U5R06_21130 [candidate division KSB1 bacterium]|nr:hypothetical protein [candidate division KSB1 bacterium]
MKFKMLIIGLVLLLFIQVSAQDRLNPPFPRIASYSMGGKHWPQYSIGTRYQIQSKYDLLFTAGTEDRDGTYKATRYRSLNPDQILIGGGVNGLWFYDPPQYYLYRSYRGYVQEEAQSNQGFIVVDSTQGIGQGVNDIRFVYAVINNDVVNVTGTSNDTIFITNDGGFYSLEHTVSVGDSVLSPIRVAGPGVIPNFSQWSPAVDGKHVWDYLAEEILLREFDWESELYDGVSHDALSPRLPITSITMDMNLNGIDDFIEMGSNPYAASRYSIDPHRREYIELWFERESELMEQLTPDLPNLQFGNAGGPCPFFFDQLNGHLYEGFLRWSSWTLLKNDCLQWMNANREKNRPSLMFIEDYIPEKWSHDGKDRFNKMRFGLTTALLFDCYYGMTFGDFYYIMLWYDEFETDLGYGTSDPFVQANGLWVRYFDKGVAVCNPTGMNQTLSPSDLDGTYYRLKGGQDPETNNGEIFDQPIELYGHDYGDDLRGDGIIMFTTPTTSVSDIIVDNFYHHSTSPGSEPVELTGNWGRYITAGYYEWDKNNPYYSQFGGGQSIGEFDEAYGYHAVSAGDGEASATWRPTIGVEGYYEISEWHGWHGDEPHSYNEASNVPFEIVVESNKIIQGVIDQTKNYGQWNQLGYVYLPKGQSAYVQINNSTDGWVIADAVRFKYLGENATPDTTAPEPPSNIRIIHE